MKRIKHLRDIWGLEIGFALDQGDRL